MERSYHGDGLRTLSLQTQSTLDHSLCSGLDGTAFIDKDAGLMLPFFTGTRMTGSWCESITVNAEIRGLSLSTMYLH
jgi:hypothetical protein